jgi:beta-ureidopropionase / N-carbamoyl-L-amino-acid hydrolase
VRSRDGRSHCPEEYSSPEDIAAGAAALGRVLLALDRRLDE